MKKTAILCIVGVLIPALAFASNVSDGGEIYKLSQYSIEERIDDLMPRMTLREKLMLLGGDVRTHLDTLAIERLGIPTLAMTDGPHGVRKDKATSFPVGVNMASTWNEELIHRFGNALAMETLKKGRNVILGPCMNISRVPHGGRNFETFSEDPYLTARIAVAYIKGVQEKDVVACAKHYACNNQELDRKTINAVVEERAMREIYLAAFRAAVQEADVWSVMASYNRINGLYACENPYLLTDILKDEWGFEGIVISDWGAVHSTIGSANAGLDIEMPYRKYFADTLLDEVKESNVSTDVIDDKVRRILRVMFESGIFDGKDKVDPESIDTTKNPLLALDMARESIVLLKNRSGLLPLDKNKIKSIAVIGPNAAVARLGGSGSSEVTPPYSISPLEGIKEQAGVDIEVMYAQGCYLDSIDDFETIGPEYLVPAYGKQGQRGLRAEYFNNTDLAGEPAHVRNDEQITFWWGYEEPAPGVRIKNFSVRWTGKLIPKKTGAYRLAAISEEGSRVYLDGKLIIDNWAPHQVVTKSRLVKLKAGQEYDVRFEYFDGGHYAIVKFGWMPYDTDPIKEAVEIAKKADVAIVMAGVDGHFEGEGHDRPSLELPGYQNKLINSVFRANKRTIVVLFNGTPVLMDQWIDKVKAVVEAWYPGMEGGRAVADVLFGNINPSGKLPVTFPKRWKDHSAYGHFPGDGTQVEFGEGIFVGYRHFDKKRIEPLFAFGHGLSYTEFEYRDLVVSPTKCKVGDKVKVELTVKNTGKVAGQEIVQLYVRDVKSSLPRPPKELKAFKKIAIEPGKSLKMSFELDKRAFSFYNPEFKSWIIEPGDFELLIASSSKDIRLRDKIKLK